MARLRLAARSYARLDRRIWTLAGVRAANTMGLSLVLSFMGIYLVTRRGVSGVEFGAIYFVANLCQAAVNTVAGRLSDRIGRRRLMASTLLARALVIALLGTLVLLHAPVLLLAAVLICSSSLRGGFEPVAFAVVADLAAPDERTAGFGLQRMGTNVGWAVGPALGGLLASVIDYGWVFFCSVVPLLLSAWAIARMVEPNQAALREARRAEASGSAALRPAAAAPAPPASAASRGELSLLLACALVFSIVQIQMFSTLSIYARSELRLVESQIGLLYTVNGIAVLLLQVPAVALISRLRHERALVVGTSIYVCALLLIGAADSHLALSAAILVATAGEVVVAPAQQATVAELGDPARLGRAFGALGTMQVLGVALAPLVGGAAYDHLRHEPMAMWGAIASLAAALALGYARFGALRRRRVPQGDGP
ncbi:MAG TPA: MFS transporter [Kofleriaceae bacterium]|nr:MFS transporter [Kofleriaceae bacterium]